jgi:hypothetical protein
MLKTLAARTALVLETNNLRGGADAERVGRSLLRVVRLLATQSVPLTALAQLVITHDGLDDACCQAVQQAAGRPVAFVRIQPETGYYEAKNQGFAATDVQHCEWVVFADADCLPATTWLAELLAPLAQDPTLAAVAGRTSYAASLAGTALTTLDFMYFPSPLAAGATRNFYANNVLFRREVFDRHSYQALNGVYRAHCQVLGLRLQAAGVAVHHAVAAHTVHRFPDSWGELLQLRWLRGQDTPGLTPFLVQAYLPRAWQWLGRSGPLGPLCVLLARLGFSLRALNHQDLPPLRGPRRLAGLALVLGFSAVDMVGAVTRGLGLRTARGTGADAQALSYHHP